MDDDDWSDPEIFWGWGSCHDLNDYEQPTPRLLGMRSVADGAAWALSKGKPPRTIKRRMGFRVPSVR